MDISIADLRPICLSAEGGPGMLESIGLRRAGDAHGTTRVLLEFEMGKEQDGKQFMAWQPRRSEMWVDVPFIKLPVFFSPDP
jgi:hypothetical protein